MEAAKHMLCGPGMVILDKSDFNSGERFKRFLIVAFQEESLYSSPNTFGSMTRTSGMAVGMIFIDKLGTGFSPASLEYAEAQR
jgi:hypothetical protein